nr:54S ribosomal protein L19, mitochondrial [Tanacetum cinerariifolium]
MASLKEILTRRPVAATVRLTIPAGQAKPGPPVGPAVGQYKVNLMAFCKDFNARTQKYKPDAPIAATVTVFKDNTFELSVRSPSVTWFLKKAAGIESGSGRAGHVVASTLNLKHIYEIAKVKQADPYCQYMSLEAISKSIIGTANSMGIKVDKELWNYKYNDFYNTFAPLWLGFASEMMLFELSSTWLLVVVFARMATLMASITFGPSGNTSATLTCVESSNVDLALKGANDRDKTLLCGLLRIPPSNAVVPQYHMHTKCLAVLKHQYENNLKLRTVKRKHERSISSNADSLGISSTFRSWAEVTETSVRCKHEKHRCTCGVVYTICGKRDRLKKLLEILAKTAHVGNLLSSREVQQGYPPPVFTSSWQMKLAGCTSLSTKIADMAAPSHSNRLLFLDELEVDGTGSIIVMVSRVWDINATTCRVNCTAKATISHNFLRLKEGGIFLIKNFTVRPNKDEFQVFRHDMFMLEFGLNNNKEDVSSYVTNVGRTSHTKSGSKTLDFYLENQSVGDSLIEKKTAHIGMCTSVLTSMTAKTYNNKLYLSSTSSMVIYDNDDIPSLQEPKSVTSLVEPKKEMMMTDSSQPMEGTIENLLLWARNRKNDTMTFQCKVMIEDTREKSVGGTIPPVVERNIGRVFPARQESSYARHVTGLYRLEVVADDTAQNVVVMFNEIATELLNYSANSLIEAEDEDDSGFPTAIRNLIGTTHVMELKSHTYYEYGSYESFTCWKINSADLVADEASSSNQLITIDDSEPSFKSLARQPSVCTPSKPNKEKRKKEDSDTDEVLCSAKDDPHEINADGPVNKKKRKM